VWYLALRHNLQPRESGIVSLDEHLSWMQQQHLAGNIVLSGPTPDCSMGIYLIRTGSRSEAEAIAAIDNPCIG
jgi:uncharacterized protein YciI